MDTRRNTISTTDSVNNKYQKFHFKRYIFWGTKLEKTPYLLNGWSICFEPLRRFLGLVPTWPYIFSLKVSEKHIFFKFEKSEMAKIPNGWLVRKNNVTLTWVCVWGGRGMNLHNNIENDAKWVRFLKSALKTDLETIRINCKIWPPLQILLLSAFFWLFLQTAKILRKKWRKLWP